MERVAGRVAGEVVRELKAKPPEYSEHELASTLASWISLNDELRDCSLEEAQELLKAEKRGKRRWRFLLRIHSRINKVRADLEREELKEHARTLP